MCGIAGVVGWRAPSTARVSETLRALGRRGPDGNGHSFGRSGDAHLALLHTRLAIIDLDPRSAQPFTADDCVLVFNGEIYNYVELRDELIASGQRFRTASDTETIIKAYREYGDEFLDRLDGMWAFALFDKRRQELLLSRDRFGEKPLYCALWEGELFFASEPKALTALSGRFPDVDEDQVRRYLVNGYRALYKSSRTFFSDVQEFPAASWCRLRSPELPKPHRYWQLAYRPESMTAAQAAEGTQERLSQAMKTRLRADVPVAFCLSGGVDSTALACIAAKGLGREVSAFTVVDRDERYNETANVTATVAHINCRHFIAPTHTSGFFERMADLVGYHDMPVTTISYYVHSALSEAIAANGYKVVVSGTAADELVTGYYDHYGFWLAEMKDRPEFERYVAEWRASYGAYVTNPLLRDPLAFARNPTARGHIYLDRGIFNEILTEPFNEDFEEERFADGLLRNRMMNELSREVVPVLLHEDDLNSMRYSIENRSPYLDRSLVEFAYSIPTEHLVKDGFTKWPLREAAADFAPPSVLADKRKRGFNATIDSVLDRRDPATLERLLAPGPIFDLVDRRAFMEFLRRDMSSNSFSKFLFSFVSARLFLESDLALGAARQAA